MTSFMAFFFALYSAFLARLLAVFAVVWDLRLCSVVVFVEAAVEAAAEPIKSSAY